MEEFENKIAKLIEMLVMNCRIEFRDDIRQDLWMYAYELKNKKVFLSAKNKDSYLFISLKNESIRLNKKYLKWNHVMSLDSLNPVTNLSYLEIIPDIKINNHSTYAKKVVSYLKVTLSETDYNLICDLFLENIPQKDLSDKYDITQQAISKRLKKIKEKIKENCILEDL